MQLSANSRMPPYGGFIYLCSLSIDMSKARKKQSKADKKIHKDCNHLISTFPNETRAWLDLCYSMATTSAI